MKDITPEEDEQTEIADQLRKVVEDDEQRH
jgi:hypothetical protein